MDFYKMQLKVVQYNLNISVSSRLRLKVLNLKKMFMLAHKWHIILMEKP